LEKFIVGTVDGFQGREKDIILLSTVRAHSDEQNRPTIGFVADRRRLNVALTRGKYGMYIIGHVKSLRVSVFEKK
jgi:superfamily I DNA and/or RNA helicase